MLDDGEAVQTRMMSREKGNGCRVCGSAHVRLLGAVEYFTGFSLQVALCGDCGCQFTPHDEAVHETFHQSGAISYYAGYRDLAVATGRLFAAGNKEGLRHHLCMAASKYRFVLDLAQRLPLGAACLEIGCSRGYLTSVLILDGLDVLGVDVSTEAVSAAKAVFGDHFALADSSRAKNGGPYDFIYHVGVIGCVADPVGLTRALLRKLKPGGLLVFNAPNLDACMLHGQLWLDSAPPPDLVTLFPHGFWRHQFAEVAHVQETVEARSTDENFRLHLSRWVGRRWCPPHPHPLVACEGHRVWLQPAGVVWRWVERVLVKVAKVTGLDRLSPVVPTDFGLFVTMQRK